MGYLIDCDLGWPMSADGNASLAREDVQDYPRPPRLEVTPQILRVELDGHLVAETRRGLRALETYHPPTYYFPAEDVLAELIPAHGSTFCEWKGVARYFDVHIKGAQADVGAWSYDKPSSTFAPLEGYVSFYAGRMSACFVGSIRVIPQPGAFYGGWVTPNLTGAIKGAAGTRHW
ncbi:DUF427 domain-containing protein [Aestuariivita sp.]|jgi:uncharacterized protein (DUF427 family)|uniref:DUF427 domain-containing protein n=1 Tax=Aestuariivita sp. TaxID=1872407 RepID=UPI0025C206E1|nr:DUF427 domain-containing protein [Aestuariivita sp.]